MAALLIPSFEILVTFTLLFISCELCGRLSTDFDDIKDLFDQKFDWYLYRLEMQRLLPIILANAQQSVGFPCFGSILCNRETFRKVGEPDVRKVGVENLIVLFSFASRWSIVHSHTSWYSADLDNRTFKVPVSKWNIWNYWIKYTHCHTAVFIFVVFRNIPEPIRGSVFVESLFSSSTINEQQLSLSGFNIFFNANLPWIDEE